MSHKPGSTLLELLVTLTIMAIIAAMVTLTLRPASATAPARGPLARVSAARRTALARHQPVTIDIVVNDSPYVVTALPDGGVVADSALHLDRLTGEKNAHP
jgi:type II secretory pathway pseudopilin PulG